MALALATVIAWLLLAAAVVARGRLRACPEWTPWDVLRGARGLAVERLSESLALRLAMVGAGHAWSRQAQAAGRSDAEQCLRQATVDTTRVLVRQLDDELAGYERHARVLQAASEPEPLGAAELKSGALQALARAERLLAAWVGPVTRLRLRLWALRRALALLARRCAPGSVRAACDVQADLTVLGRATVGAYRTLLASLAVSRRRLGEAGAPRRGPESRLH